MRIPHRVGPVANPRSAAAAIAAATAVVNHRLGPPLQILPTSLEAAELLQFRADYQAFRAGQAVGARGEISALPDLGEEEEGGAAAPAAGGAASSRLAGPSAGGSSGAIATLEVDEEASALSVQQVRAMFGGGKVWGLFTAGVEPLRFPRTRPADRSIVALRCAADAPSPSPSCTPAKSLTSASPAPPAPQWPTSANCLRPCLKVSRTPQLCSKLHILGQHRARLGQDRRSNEIRICRNRAYVGPRLRPNP